MNRRVTGATFTCRDCGKEWDAQDARYRAYQHHRATGHTTSGEQVEAFRYESQTKDHSK